MHCSSSFFGHYSYPKCFLTNFYLTFIIKKVIKKLKWDYRINHALALLKTSCMVHEKNEPRV